MKRAMLLLGLMLLSIVAWAGGPMPDVDPKKAGDALILGMSGGVWLLVAAGGGLIVIWLLRLLLLPNLKGKALAWTSSILIGLASFGTTIVAAPDKWIEAIAVGVGALLSAAKAWDLLTATKVGNAVMKQPIVNRQK